MERQRKDRNAERARDLYQNPGEKMISIQRTRLRLELGRVGLQKSQPMLDIIGCSKITLARWIESNFAENMSWENFGQKWQIDHVIPIQAFDLSTMQGQQACFHWSNLYPMDTKTNQYKGKQIWDQYALHVQEKAERFVQSEDSFE